MRDKIRAECSFQVVDTDGGVQTAVMILPRDSESGPLGNPHPESTQVIAIVRGEVDAEIGDERMHLIPGDSAIVPKGTPHRFVGTSDETAVTVNIDTPPAYDSAGETDKSAL